VLPLPIAHTPIVPSDKPYHNNVITCITVDRYMGYALVVVQVLEGGPSADISPLGLPLGSVS
jgi:hypothetical protein